MTEALSSYRIDSERAASALFARAFPLLSVDHARNREAQMRLMARGSMPRANWICGWLTFIAT